MFVTIPDGVVVAGSVADTDSLDSAPKACEILDWVALFRAWMAQQGETVGSIGKPGWEKRDGATDGLDNVVDHSYTVANLVGKNEMANERDNVVKMAEQRRTRWCGRRPWMAARTTTVAETREP